MALAVLQARMSSSRLPGKVLAPVAGAPMILRHSFRLAGHAQAAAEGEVRWTVDRPDDLEFVRAVYDVLYPADPAFGSDAVRAFVRSRPDLTAFGGGRRV